MVAFSVATVIGTDFRISMPVIRGAQVASHLPLMGIEGADQMLGWVEEYLQTLR